MESDPSSPLAALATPAASGLVLPEPPAGLVLEVRPAANPVLLIPGYCEPLQLFLYLERALRVDGLETVGVADHFPALWDIRASAERLARKVELVRRNTGAAKVDLLAHSLGGLMSRYFIKFLGGDEVVDRCITLATPHHGTLLAHLMPDAASRQMRPGSDFLEELNAGREAWGDVRYTSVWTRMDQIVIPQDSAHLQGADNHTLLLGFHNQMMFTGGCLRHVRNALRAPARRSQLLLA